MASEELFGREADILNERRYRLLLLANVVAALGTALISPILDTLTGAFGVSAARIGLMVTAVTAPPVVLIPLVGLLMDRYGRKPTLLAGLMLFGLGGTLIAFTTDFRVVLALRLIQGVGFAGTVPVIITCIGDLYADSREATGQGLRFAVSGLSQAVFPALAGLLALVAWYYPFFIYGLAIPVAVFLYFWFDEPTTVVGSDSPVADGSGDRPVPDRRAYFRGLASLVSHRRVSTILVARFVIVAPFIGFLTYNSLVVVRLMDGSPFHAGLVVAIFSLVYAVAATQSGRITAMFDSRARPLIAANLSMGVGLVIFVMTPWIVVAGLAAALLGIGVGLTFSLYRSIITGYAPEVLRGGLVGLGESLGRLSASLTPVVIGISLTLLEPHVGEPAALQLSLGAIGAFAGLVGALSIVVLKSSPPLPGNLVERPE